MRFLPVVENINIDSVSVSKLAELTPRMTEEQFLALKNSIKDIGQQEPVLIYKGEIVDGRHRYLALNELEIDTIKVKYIHNEERVSDVREYILKVSENRRHQTPTQKAIYAYYIYLDEVKNSKVSQGEIAELYGTNRLMLSRAKKLDEVAGRDVLDFLFDGNKINIGSKEKPIYTESLLSLINFYKKIKEEPINNSTDNTNTDLTDDEKQFISDMFRLITAEANHITIRKLADRLYSYVGSK